MLCYLFNRSETASSNEDMLDSDDKTISESEVLWHTYY